MTRWLGQDAAIDELLEALDRDRLHHGWLFGGPEGVGKGGIARDFAKRLLGAAGPVDRVTPFDDDPVARLVDAGTHPDMVIVARQPKETKKRRKDDEEAEPELARNITVDQIRGLSRFLHLAPSMATRRVVIVDVADDLERGAANAILKNLEEPPRDTIFLLISHAPGRLLPTIRSRCRALRFQPLSLPVLEQVLAEQAPHLAADARSALARGAEGSPGRALAGGDLDIAGLETALGRIADGGDPDHRIAMPLARALAGKAAQPRLVAFLELVPHFIARRLRDRRDSTGAAKAGLWAEAVALSQGAIAPLQLDPTATVLALCGVVARLAPERV